MITFFKTIDGFKSIDVYYKDTDFLYIKSKHCDKLNKVRLIRKNIKQGKNFYRGWLFSAPKIKYCLTVRKCGVIIEHKTITNGSEKLEKKTILKC